VQLNKRREIIIKCPFSADIQYFVNSLQPEDSAPIVPNSVLWDNSVTVELPKIYWNFILSSPLQSSNGFLLSCCARRRYVVYPPGSKLSWMNKCHESVCSRTVACLSDCWVQVNALLWLG
jgi:hypothetical protein